MPDSTLACVQLDLETSAPGKKGVGAIPAGAIVPQILVEKSCV